MVPAAVLVHAESRVVRVGLQQFFDWCNRRRHKQRIHWFTCTPTKTNTSISTDSWQRVVEECLCKSCACEYGWDVTLLYQFDSITILGSLFSFFNRDSDLLGFDSIDYGNCLFLEEYIPIIYQLYMYTWASPHSGQCKDISGSRRRPEVVSVVMWLVQI